jgi:UDP-N-acetylglucosamine 2-epimerase (non-hydrolysing)
VGTDTDRIIKTVHSLLDDGDAYQKMARAVNPYGDGHAADRIVQALIDFENRHPKK